ncbi:MAG: hypothetical protein ABEJ87_05625 [Candidatus Nanohalobium sp.]
MSGKAEVRYTEKGFILYEDTVSGGKKRERSSVGRPSTDKKVLAWFQARLITLFLLVLALVFRTVNFLLSLLAAIIRPEGIYS